MNRPIICCVDGNIGAGKSTILNTLKENGYPVFEEDLSNWGMLLDKFYQDPKRWMCTLQIKILQSMRQQYDRMCAHEGPEYVFVERSPLSSMIFVDNGVQNGFLDTDELALIKEIFNHLSWKPDISFYLNTDVDTCFRRMKERNRECEKTVDKKYLQFLHDGYMKTYEEGIGAHIVDGIPPVAEVVRQILDKLSKVI